MGRASTSSVSKGTSWPSLRRRSLRTASSPPTQTCTTKYCKLRGDRNTNLGHPTLIAIRTKLLHAIQREKRRERRQACTTKARPRSSAGCLAAPPAVRPAVHPPCGQLAAKPPTSLVRAKRESGRLDFISDVLLQGAAFSPYRPPPFFNRLHFRIF